jgi:multiple sugar transport system substrate-binding protein
MTKRLLNLLVVVSMLLVFVPVVTAAPPAQGGAQDYVVVKDDWVSKLADKYLGNKFAYPAIVDATNKKAATDSSYAKITNPDVIEVGWKLYIPSAADAAAFMSTYAPAAAAPTGPKPDLSIIWFEWPPCHALSELVAKYPDANVTVKCIPIAQWHDQIFTDFAAKGGADFPIGDSQWVGEAVKGGHYLELTDWMKNNIQMDDYVPAALAAYGEYPPNSGRYYGVPAMTDVQVLVYRKDLFAEKGFTPAATWTDLLKQAQAFKQEGKVSGWVWFWCGSAACLDQIQSAWNEVLWSFGGELWDPTTFKVQGVLNNADGIAAVDFARQLYLTGPEGAGNWQYAEVVDAICTGKAAMTGIWVGFATSFMDKQGCPQSDNLAFAVLPGEKKHVLQLGGMGIHVSAYTKNKDAALAFLKWFESTDGQTQWVKLGGYTARKSVLASDAFKNAAPYNPIFAESYVLVKDFWNVPEYAKMLLVEGEQLNLAVTGQITSKAALDTIATEQQKILDEAYPNGPPK